MSGPAFLAQPSIQRLPGLLAEIKRGEIQIPRFQRPFVWRDEQRVLLLDSIYNGLPIGSILIWRTSKHDLACYDRLGPLALGRATGQAGASSPIRQYLLDGHQRLATLYVALSAGLVTGVDAEQTTLPGLGEIDGWPIYFDLKDPSFYVEDRRRVRPTWLPLNILFNPVGLLEFQKKLVEDGQPKRLVNLAENLASTFKDYTIPVVPIATDDLELVTTSFQRINSAGRRMDEVHMVSALTWSTSFDLNQRLEEIRESLGAYGWQGIEDRMILNTCKAALDLDIYKSDVEEVRDQLRANPDVLNQARDNLAAAAQLLATQCHVRGPLALPYAYQIVLLAEAMRQIKRKPIAEHQEQLRRWFWITSFTEYFAGINSTRMRLALEHVRELVSGGINPAPPDVNFTVRPRRRFDYRAARSRALALLLAEQRPLDPLGKPVDAFALLAQHGASAMAKIVPNAWVLGDPAGDGSENRMILEPKYTTELREGLAQADDKFLESHLINGECYAALKNEDWTTFLESRGRAIRALEQRHVESYGMSYEDLQA